jgi:hypothetical protein
VATQVGNSLKIDPRSSGAVYRQRLPPELEQAHASFDDIVKGGGGDECADPRPEPGARPPNPTLDPRRTFPRQVLESAKPWRDLLECRNVPCQAYPNRDNGCYGMCGPSCSTCWEWVCGDCCFHQFCAAHDATLRACEKLYLDKVAELTTCVLATAPWYYVLSGCVDSLWDRLF